MKPYIDLYRRWIAVPGVQAAEIAVLSALYARADPMGLCTATQGELAEELRQSRSWIHAILKNLQDPAVALVAARTRRGFRGFLYELAGASISVGNSAGDTMGQPADSGAAQADILVESLNPESSFSRAGGSRPLPIDWWPTADDLAWAATERPDVEAATVTGKFVAWCRKAHARNGYSPADPSAAWRRWVARELVAFPASPSATSSRQDIRHERSIRPSADGHSTDSAGIGQRGDGTGAGLAARNRSTLAALRHRLACPA